MRIMGRRLLACYTNLPLITADKGLFNAGKKDLKWIKWLGDV